MLGKALLNEAYLGSAQLKGAYLDGAQLEGADLSGAQLEGVLLREANLARAVFTDAEGLTWLQLQVVKNVDQARLPAYLVAQRAEQAERGSI